MQSHYPQVSEQFIFKYTRVLSVLSMHIPLILPHPEGQKKLFSPLYFGVRKRLGVNICTNEHILSLLSADTAQCNTRVCAHTHLIKGPARETSFSQFVQLSESS